MGATVSRFPAVPPRATYLLARGENISPATVRSTTLGSIWAIQSKVFPWRVERPFFALGTWTAKSHAAPVGHVICAVVDVTPKFSPQVGVAATTSAAGWSTACVSMTSVCAKIPQCFREEGEHHDSKDFSPQPDGARS